MILSLNLPAVSLKVKDSGQGKRRFVGDDVPPERSPGILGFQTLPVEIWSSYSIKEIAFVLLFDDKNRSV